MNIPNYSNFAARMDFSALPVFFALAAVIDGSPQQATIREAFAQKIRAIFSQPKERFFTNPTGSMPSQLKTYAWVLPLVVSK